MVARLNTRTDRASMALRIRLARARAARETDPQEPYVRPRREPPPPPPVEPPRSSYPVVHTFEHSVWGSVKHLDAETVMHHEYGASGPPTGLGHAVLNLPTGKVHKGVAFNNVRWMGLMGDACRMRWGLRAFDLVDASFTECEVLGEFDEHGLYLGAPGNLRLRRVRIKGCNAAGIQVAHRFDPHSGKFETIIPEWAQKESTHLYEDCEFLDLGKPGVERFGAFSLSEHPIEVVLEDGTRIDDMECDVVVLRSRFKGNNFEHFYGGQGGQLWRSNRSIMAGNRRSLRVIDSEIDCPDPVHGWALQGHNNRTTILERTYFANGNIEIKNPKKVRLAGCEGSGTITVGTGPGKGEGLTKILYKGPIETDWSFSEV